MPGGVIRAANSASTLRPYDPSAILGDTSPTTPAPQAAAAKSKCGVFGQILLVAVAIAVTAVAPFGGGVAASVANGVLGSVVSQSVGVATGIQDKFSFKGVALAGISAGIAAGVGQIAANAAANAGGALGDVGKFLGGTGFGAGAARGALTGTLTQGVAVATGLQAKFDFAGVAAAGVIGGVGDWAAGKLGGAAHHDAGGNAVKATFGNQLGASAASAIAGAAARSLLTGTSFGDNLLATLPDVIGATVGRAIGESLTGGGGPRTTAVAIEAGDIVVAPFPRVVDGLTAGIPWLGEAPGGGAASATGTTAAVTAVSKGDAGQMRTRGGLLEQNGYAPQQSETREQNVAQTSTADAAIRSRIDLSANDKDRLLTELYNRSSYWASVLPAAGALDSIIGGAGSIDLSVGSFDILHASDSRLTLFGPNGLDIDSERFSIGGPNGLFTTSDSLMLGGRSGIVSTNGSISIGGPGGIYAGTNHISIGGAFGLNADSNGIGIGRYSLGFSAEVVGKLGTVGGKGSFASERQLVDHFGRHGADFGSQTPAEYAQQANAFLGGSLGTNALERVRPATGYVVRFNPITDEFGIIRSNGIIRTYYRPNPTVHRYKNNLEYFNAQ